MKLHQTEFEFMKRFKPKRKPLTRFLTFEERKFIQQSLENNISINSICNTLGRWPSGIEQEIKKGNIDGKYNAEHAQNQDRCTAFLGYEERKKIESLLNEKISGHEIAKILKRSPSTIFREINRGKVDGKYCAETAQTKPHRQSSVNLDEYIKVLPSNLEERLTVLENQIKLLTEIIKENLT